jgi:hypothetical protein
MRLLAAPLRVGGKVLWRLAMLLCCPREGDAARLLAQRVRNAFHIFLL